MRKASPTESPRLNLFLVGAPKTGSTLLADLLGLHPDVFVAEGKDRNFFATDLEYPAALRDEDRYWEMFEDWSGEHRVGEASVYYLYSEAALHRIHSRFPDAAIVVQVRNPVDLIHSYHRQMVFNGWQPVEEFERVAPRPDEDDPVRAGRKVSARIRAAREQRPSLEEEDVESSDMDSRLLDYDFIGRLSPHIQRWMEVFGEERVVLVVFDELVSEPEGVVRRLFGRLEVDPEARIDLESVLGDEMSKNPHKVRRSVLLREAIHRPGPWLRRLVRFLLPSQRLRGRIAAFFDRLNRKFVERETSTSGLHERLHEYFEPEVRRLEDLCSRDLSHWLERGASR